jgi:fatty acid desaturase
MSIATVPSDDQKQRAAWDLLLLDIEHRTEQVRQLKSYEPWRVIFAGFISGAAILAVGVAIGHWLLG